MARSNRPKQVRQRSRQEATREAIYAHDGERSQTFGIRRMVHPDTAEDFASIIKLIKDDNVLPEAVDFRGSHHATLLPRGLLDWQLRKGLLPGYEYGKVSGAVRKRIIDGSPETAAVTIGKPRIFRGGHVGMPVEGSILDKEHRGVKLLMGEYGLRGVNRQLGKLHITVAEIPRSMDLQDRGHMLDVLETFMPIGRIVTLGQVNIYPLPGEAGEQAA